MTFCSFLFIKSFQRWYQSVESMKILSLSVYSVQNNFIHTNKHVPVVYAAFLLARVLQTDNAIKTVHRTLEKML